MVSVMIPCFNAAHSLRWAIGSLLAQSFTDWECLVVDDGSTDETWEVLQRISDQRFRLRRLAQNEGRGAARAAALEMARGRFIAMVDADDWIYPNKLAVQVERLLLAPDCALVTSAMAITDRNGSIIGRQGPSLDQLIRAAHRIHVPPVPHAPSLIRTDIARWAEYDRGLRFSEDFDLLVKICREHDVLLCAEPSYAYTQPGSMSVGKLASSYASELRIWRKYLRSEPTRALQKTLSAVARRETYRAGYALGLGDWLVSRRWRAPSIQEVAAFDQARTVVAEQVTLLEAQLALR